MSTNADKDSVNELSLFAQKRLLKDIRNIHCDKTLKDNGIYYIHSTSEMARGYALIIGPEDTPYQHGAYLFEITFPENYPHSPPKFKYLTNDGKTRYHPNLYTNGKVCLSILNTWKGDQWTSSITLSHILLNILSILLLIINFWFVLNLTFFLPFLIINSSSPVFPQANPMNRNIGNILCPNNMRCLVILLHYSWLFFFFYSSGSNQGLHLLHLNLI
mgnify:CR=1 FL=1